MLIPNKQKRFQYQPWYIKVWRQRWYLVVPYNFIVVWFNNKSLKDYRNTPVYTKQLCYDIAISEAHLKMKIYTDNDKHKIF